MDDAGQQVRVGAGGDGVEEVGGDALGAVGDGGPAQVGLGRGDRGITVGEDCPKHGVGVQDLRQEDTAAASDVDQPAEAREVVGGDDVSRLLFGAGGHRLLKGSLSIGVLGEVVEEPLPVNVLEGGASSLDGLQEPATRGVVHLATGESGAVDRCEALADRRQGESPVVVLHQHLIGHQAPQDADQRIAVGAHRVGDLLAATGPVGEDIGNAELGRHIEELGGHEAVEQTHQSRLRRDDGRRHDDIFSRPSPAVDRNG